MPEMTEMPGGTILMKTILFTLVMGSCGCGLSVQVGIMMLSEVPPTIVRNVTELTCDNLLNATIYSVVVQKGQRLVIFREVNKMLTTELDMLLLPDGINEELDITSTVKYLQTLSEKTRIVPYKAPTTPTTVNEWCLFLQSKQDFTSTSPYSNSTLTTVNRSRVVDVLVDILTNIREKENFTFIVEEEYVLDVMNIKTKISSYGISFQYYQTRDFKYGNNLHNWITQIRNNGNSFVFVLASLSSLQFLLNQVKEFEDQSGNKFTLSQQARWLMVIGDDESSKNMIQESAGYLNNLAVVTTPYMDGTNHFSYVSSCHTAKLYTILWKPHGRELSFLTALNGSVKLDHDIDIFPNVHKGFNQRTLIIATLPYNPFVFKKTINNVIVYSGFCIDLLHELSRTMNFSYKIVEPEDGQWGDITNGMWTGIVGDIYRNKADMAVAPLSATKERQHIISFSYPFYLEHATVILKPPDPQASKWKTFLKPFRYEVLICVGVSLFVGTVLLYCLEAANPFYRYSTSTNIHIQSFSDVFWYLYGALLTQGGESLPTSLAGRKFVGFWWLFCIMMVATYSGNLVAFLTINKIELPFETLVGLANQEDYKWGTQGGTAFTTLFFLSKTGVYKQIGDGLRRFNKSDTDVTNTNPDIHYRKVREGKYAYISDKTQLSLQAANCSLYVLKEEFYPLHYSIALPKSSNLENAVSEEIIRIIESGILSLWMKKWWPRTDLCGSTAAQAKRITIIDIQSAFYVICIGIVISLFVLLMECVTKKIGCRLEFIPKQIKMLYYEDSNTSVVHGAKSSTGPNKNRINK